MSESPAAQGSGASNIPDSRGINFFRSDPGLAPLLRAYLGDTAFTDIEAQLIALGQRASDELDALALSADHHPPTLQHRTRRGEAIQHIDKHPDYVALERVAYAELGLAAMSHREHAPAPLVKYALTYLFVQAEFGLCCPVSMTDSLTRTLRKFGTPDLIARYLPMLASQDFDTLFQGAMFMTEQAAGSDVARIATRAAREIGADGTETWRLYGDKWFCSNADADLAMVLARVDGAPAGIKGLALFLLPKTLPDGTRNTYRIVRLKDKLGSRSMASGEIVLEGAQAYLIGEIGRGFHQMADMINMSRLSNGVRAAGLMRRALTEALHIARHREAFGRKLIDMPLMQRQLLKMMLPAEQARTLFMRIATLLPRADRGDRGDESAAKCVRILTPMIKFRACRDARRVTGDAMEVRGGVGYIEEWSDARLVRDAHLGSIWEGTSNIVALDVARAAKREGALDALSRYLRAELAEAGLPEASAALLRAAFERAGAALESVAECGRDESVRQAASALYHATTAAFMACEAAEVSRAGTEDYRRLALAHLIVRHKLLPRDPLALDDRDAHATQLRALVDETPLPLADAMQLLPAQ
ncbi:acyl-CoA dehydrogenase family protein [Paraburkholderia sp.]|uniref:acyl-CoA dehydrogenase family protein n=1 Tax=Paraburkholderia sp. TaxID=1926495 RepID=UPI00286F08F2|nr:acyl-CoA dehydrogenase family protein [Paraburkholderia sp.]